MVEPSASILLVDDEPHILTNLERIFSARGYSVSIADGGEEALSMLRTQKFDVCVLDLLMSDVTGHDVMDRIRADRLDTSVVILSGDTNIDAAISALTHRAYAFVKKPFEPETLIKTIDDAISTRKLRKEKITLESQLRKSQRFYRYITRHSPDLIYLVDQQGHFIYVNDWVEGLLGIKRGELTGRHYKEIVVDEDLAAANYRFNERRAGARATRNLEIRLKKQQYTGSGIADVVPIELSAEGIYTNHDIGTKSLHGTLGVARNISARKKREKQVTFMAYHDSLTGLPNRLLLKDRFDQALEQAKRGDYLLVVMFLDLDGFKQINDSLGHKVGDRLLQSFSQRLREGLRKADTLARIGGDEFILMLPQLQSVKYAEVVAEKIIEKFDNPFVVDTHELVLSVSIGISVFPFDGDSQESLIEHADAAMYNVKKERGKSYSFYSSMTESTQKKNTILETDLHKALEKSEFTLFYQPVYGVSENRVAVVEAFLRWHHPEKGLFFPESFLALAEETGVMLPISVWAFETTCQALKRWDEQGLIPIKISLNVSASHIKQEDFVDTIIDIFNSYDLPPNRLQIALKEHVLSEIPGGITEKLAELRRNGIEIVIENREIDDSSLSLLAKLQVDAIKVDCAGLELSLDEGLLPMVAGFIDKAKRMGLQVIAQNVETENQASRLKMLEFDAVQGFLYHHPVSAEAVSHLLPQKRWM